MNKFETIAEQSDSPETALVALHDAGATPVEAIKALRNGCGLSLADGKSKLMESPAWKFEAAAADRLHEEIIELLDKGNRD